ncbi:MAG: hypothetical protein KDB54_06225 [Solirubrobacterales bacterium]|nr:hypothetical protein [Solirubrobacterales bacterium]HRV60744.1 hypothetical protein [Solirubrobacterales bacterium]
MTGRLAAITTLLGALVVILSQVVTAYSLENELGEILDTVTLLSKHGVITAIIGLIAALATVFAVAAGNRSATIVVIGAGAAVVLVFLFVDVPDIGSTGMFTTQTAGNLDATAKAEAGLWLELLGGVILILGGLALRTLDEEQLRAIGPRIQGGSAARPSADKEKAS